MRALLFRLLRPVVILVGKIHVPFSVKSAARHFYSLTAILQPGDVILATTYGHASNWGNPGRFKHVILYVGVEAGRPMIVEAIGDGRRKYDNFFCSELCLAFWQKINPGISFVLMKTFGVDTVSPNDFYRAAPKKTEVLFDSQHNRI